MGLESSHERTRQVLPSLAASTEAGHSSGVQENSAGEQLPAHVALTPVLSNSDDLVDLLLTWIRTPDWSTSRTYLQAHAELLTEPAEHILGK